MSKEVLGVIKIQNDMKVLRKIAKKPLRITIETLMFKYFQRFLFLVSDTVLYESFEGETNF